MFCKKDVQKPFEYENMENIYYQNRTVLMAGTIILAEDDPVQQIVVRTMLEKELPYQVLLADNGHDVLTALSDKRINDIKLIILDVEMPDMGGMETLQYIHEQFPHIPVVMLTAVESVEVAVQAMKKGAIDFISKPPMPEHLRVSVLNAMRLQTLENEVGRLRREQSGHTSFLDLIGHDHGLAPMIAKARKAASSNIPVLIQGETGTGKELVARAIHGESERSGGAFVAINCGAIPKDLVESTLFGHEKGAFTGAIQRAVGKFREAEGGTIFLDEIGELPKDAQVKLLRVLQQQEVEPVGAGKPVSINVRIVSATHRDLQQDVKNGMFREDLFFRLNVLPLSLPPLRQRKEDIDALTDFFVQSIATTEKLPLKIVSKEARGWLREQNWPGNIRALQNTLRRAMVLAEGDTITLADVAQEGGLSSVADATTHKQLRVSLLDELGQFRPYSSIEAELMQRALEHFDYNVTRSAQAVGIAKSTFYKKMKLYGL